MESESERHEVIERENQGREIDMTDNIQKKPPAVSEQVTSRLEMMQVDRGGAMRPGSMGEFIEMSKMIAASDLAPKDYQGRAGNVLVAMQMGSELGLAPMQAIQNIAVINGRPSLWGDAMLAVVQSHPDFVDIEEMDMKDIEAAGAATCTIHRKGRTSRTATFSVNDAKTAKLWGKGGPWSQYPSRMLQMRARAFACRDMFSDALRGIQSAEEARDIPEDVHVVARVKTSAPSSILGRLKAQKGDAEPEEAPPADAVDSETGEVAEPDPAPGNPAQGNGEASDEEEERMMAAEAEANAERGEG